MGVQMIDTIKNDLLKSAELTGQWERQLRDIESGEYTAQQFIGEMRTMVNKLVSEVSAERGNKRLAQPIRQGKFSKNEATATQMNLARPKKMKGKQKQAITEMTCPKCQRGTLLKGKAAYGCSAWKSGCTFRLPFSFKEKEIPELQLVRLVEQGATIQLRGFQEKGRKINGNLVFNDQFELYLKPKTTNRTVPFKKLDRQKIKSAKKTKAATVPDKLICPKCGKGTILKGKTAYGCSAWKAGCDFRYAFEDVRRSANGQTLTKALVWEILNK